MAQRTGALRSPRFWISMAGGLGIVLAAVLLTNHDGAMTVIQAVYARITCGILNGLGHATRVVGNTVSSSRFGISVVAACTGLFVTSLFAFAVVVFPVRWGSKLVGLALGIGGIFVVNVIRLVSLYYVGVHWPGVLDSVHLLVWQSLLIVVAVALWLLWAGGITRRRGREASS